MSTAVPTPDIAAGDGIVSRRSMLVAAFSTMVEWYDFTLYLYFATILSRVFFGGGADSLAATSATPAASSWRPSS